MKVGNRPLSAHTAFHSIRELRSHRGKLKQMIFKLRKRDYSLLEMCTRALEKDQRQLAKIYANELAQIRTMINTFSQSDLAIEIIIIRLENLIELNKLSLDLRPTIKEIQSLSRYVSKMMPEIGHLMQKLYRLVNNTLTETSLNFSQLPLTIKSIEGEEILKEVSAHIEQKLAEKLPEPPRFTIPSKEKRALKEREAISIAVG